MLRGESVIAGAGLLTGAILLVVMGGLAIGVHMLGAESDRQARQERVGAAARELGGELPLLVEFDRLTELRRRVQDLTIDDAVENVRVLLGDGQVIAASELDEITTSALPSSLPPMREDIALLGERVQTANGELVVVVDAGGDAALGEDTWAIQAAVGGAGALAMAGLWFVYRRLRKKLGAIGAVRDALLAAADGETCAGALAVSDDLGPAARAWNSLLGDREALRERMVSERAGEVVVRSRQGRGDADSVCDALWHGVMVVDDQGRIRYANGAAAVFVDRDRDELRGLTLESLVDDPSLRTALRRVLTGEVKRRMSVEICAEGEREDVLRFTVRPLRGLDGGDAMVVIEDVTQQRIATRATGGFVAQATHELRTPLTNIRLYAEEAIDLNNGDPGERSRCLNVINQETRRLERLVGDMLSISEMESGALTLHVGSVRLERVMSDIQGEFEAQALKRGVALSFDLPPKFPVFGCDRAKFTLVLNNLLGNAIKYTPSGGKVDVRVLASDDELQIDVCDTGIGISQEDQSRVFDPFFRTDDARAGGFGGTGLGLAIAHEIASLHGGDITLESAPGKGSTFTIRIPNSPVIDREMAA